MARRADRVDRDVADLAAVARRRRSAGCAVDDQAAADADLAGDEQDVVRRRSRHRGGPRPGRRGRRRWRPGSAPARRERWARRSPSGTSFQPRFGAMETKPSARRTTPTIATPTPISGPSTAGGREAGGQLGQVGGDLVDRDVAARSVDPDDVEELPPSPTSATASESTAISSARTTRLPRFETDERRGRPGVPSGVARTSDTRPAGDELADQPADGAARETGPRDQLGARQRPALVELADDGAQVRPADGFAPLADVVARRSPQDLCSSLQNVCDRLCRLPCWCYKPADGQDVATRSGGSRRRQRRGRVLAPGDDLAALGHPRSRPHRAAARPGIPRRRAASSWRSPAGTPGAQRPFAGTHGIPRAFGSYEALLAAPGRRRRLHLAARTTSTPSGRSAPLEAGKHVLCEKPLALTVGRASTRSSPPPRRAGRIAVEAFMYLHHPQILRAVRELARSGALGPLELVNGSFSFFLTYPDDPRIDPAMGGGSLWDVGCYPVSFARRIAGEEPDRVAAFARFDERGVDRTFVGQLRLPERPARPVRQRLRRPGPRADRDRRAARPRWSSDSPFLPEPDGPPPSLTMWRGRDARPGSTSRRSTSTHAEVEDLTAVDPRWSRAARRSRRSVGVASRRSWTLDRGRPARLPTHGRRRQRRPERRPTEPTAAAEPVEARSPAQPTDGHRPDAAARRGAGCAAPVAGRSRPVGAPLVVAGRRSASSSPGRGSSEPACPPRRRTTPSGPSPGAGTRRCSTRSGAPCRTRRSTRATCSTPRSRCGTPGRPTTRPRAGYVVKEKHTASDVDRGPQRGDQLRRLPRAERRASSRRSAAPSRCPSSTT